MDHFMTELRWLRERFAELAESQQHDRGGLGTEQPMKEEIWRANNVLNPLINIFHDLNRAAHK